MHINVKVQQSVGESYCSVSDLRCVVCGARLVVAEMDSSHVTDDVSAPANDVDDDVNNPFYEALSPPQTTATEAGASDIRSKFHPGTVHLSGHITLRCRKCEKKTLRLCIK